MQCDFDGNCLYICLYIYFAVWYDISDQNRCSFRSPGSGVIDLIKQLIILDINVITLISMLSTCLRKVSWSQITAGHSCVIDRSNSLIFAFNQRQLYWINFDQWFEFMFCLWSVFVWLVYWFWNFWSAMSITSRLLNPCQV